MLLDSRRVFLQYAKIEQAIERKALQDELKQVNSADKVYWGSWGNILKPKLNEIKTENLPGCRASSLKSWSALKDIKGRNHGETTGAVGKRRLSRYPQEMLIFSSLIL